MCVCVHTHMSTHMHTHTHKCTEPIYIHIFLHFLSIFSYRYTHIHQTAEFVTSLFTILPPGRSLLMLKNCKTQKRRNQWVLGRLRCLKLVRKLKVCGGAAATQCVWQDREEKRSYKDVPHHRNISKKQKRNFFFQQDKTTSYQYTPNQSCPLGKVLLLFPSLRPPVMR